MGAWVVGERRKGETRIRSQSGMPVVEEVYYYLIETDSVNETFFNVRTASGLPRIGQSIGFLACVGIDCSKHPQKANLWEATVTFSTEVQEGQDSFDPSTDPVAWIPVRETLMERMDDIVPEDLDGEKVANSAGQPFENLLTIGRWVPYWEFYQFEPATVTDEDIVDRHEVTNDATYKGKDAGTWLLTVESSVLGFYYGLRRRLTFYALRYNKHGWKHKRPDVGTFDKDGNPAQDANSVGVHLRGLDGAGGLVTFGDPPANLEFRVHEEADFSSFLRI